MGCAPSSVEVEEPNNDSSTPVQRSAKPNSAIKNATPIKTAYQVSDSDPVGVHTPQNGFMKPGSLQNEPIQSQNNTRPGSSTKKSVNSLRVSNGSAKSRSGVSMNSNREMSIPGTVPIDDILESNKGTRNPPSDQHKMNSAKTQLSPSNQSKYSQKSNNYEESPENPADEVKSESNSPEVTFDVEVEKDICSPAKEISNTVVNVSESSDSVKPEANITEAIIGNTQDNDIVSVHSIKSRSSCATFTVDKAEEHESSRDPKDSRQHTDHEPSDTKELSESEIKCEEVNSSYSKTLDSNETIESVNENEHDNKSEACSVNSELQDDSPELDKVLGRVSEADSKYDFQEILNKEEQENSNKQLHEISTGELTDSSNIDLQEDQTVSSQEFSSALSHEVQTAVSENIPDSVTQEISKIEHQEVLNVVGDEVSVQEVANRESQESTKDVFHEHGIPDKISDGASEESPNDISQEISNDVSQNILNNESRETSNDVSQDTSNETMQEVPYSVPQDVPNCVPQEDQNVPNDELQIGKDGSEDISKSVTKEDLNGIPDDEPHDVSQAGHIQTDDDTTDEGIESDHRTQSDTSPERSSVSHSKGKIVQSDEILEKGFKRDMPSEDNPNSSDVGLTSDENPVSNHSTTPEELNETNVNLKSNENQDNSIENEESSTSKTELEGSEALESSEEEQDKTTIMQDKDDQRPQPPAGETENQLPTETHDDNQKNSSSQEDSTEGLLEAETPQQFQAKHDVEKKEFGNAFSSDLGDDLECPEFEPSDHMTREATLSKTSLVTQQSARSTAVSISDLLSESDMNEDSLASSAAGQLAFPVRSSTAKYRFTSAAERTIREMSDGNEGFLTKTEEKRNSNSADNENENVEPDSNAGDADITEIKPSSNTDYGTDLLKVMNDSDNTEIEKTAEDSSNEEHWQEVNLLSSESMMGVEVIDNSVGNNEDETIENKIPNPLILNGPTVENGIKIENKDDELRASTTESEKEELYETSPSLVQKSEVEISGSKIQENLNINDAHIGAQEKMDFGQNWKDIKEEELHINLEANGINIAQEIKSDCEENDFQLSPLIEDVTNSDSAGVEEDSKMPFIELSDESDDQSVESYFDISKQTIIEQYTDEENEATSGIPLGRSQPSIVKKVNFKKLEDTDNVSASSITEDSENSEQLKNNTVDEIERTIKSEENETSSVDEDKNKFEDLGHSESDDVEISDRNKVTFHEKEELKTTTGSVPESEEQKSSDEIEEVPSSANFSDEKSFEESKHSEKNDDKKSDDPASQMTDSDENTPKEFEATERSAILNGTESEKNERDSDNVNEDEKTSSQESNYSIESSQEKKIASKMEESSLKKDSSTKLINRSKANVFEFDSIRSSQEDRISLNNEINRYISQQISRNSTPLPDLAVLSRNGSSLAIHSGPGVILETVDSVS